MPDVERPDKSPGETKPPGKDVTYDTRAAIDGFFRIGACAYLDDEQLKNSQQIAEQGIDQKNNSLRPRGGNRCCGSPFRSVSIFGRTSVLGR